MKRTRSSAVSFVALCVLVPLLNQACFSAQPWRTRQQPWDPVVLEKAKQVRVHKADGTFVVLVEVTLEESPQGTFLRGTVIDDEGNRLGEVVLPAYDITQLETRKLEALRVAAKAGIWVGVAVVGAYIVAVTVLGCIFAWDCALLDAPDGVVSQAWMRERGL